MERQEILRCRACPHGQKLLDACSSKMPVADMDDVEALPIPKTTQQTKLVLPQRPTIETQPQRHIWTVSELAAALGVKGKDIYNARNTKGSGRPGSRSHSIISAMRRRGISWDNVATRAFRSRAKDKAARISAPEGADASPADSATPDKGAVAATVPMQALIAALKNILPPGTSITITA